MALFGLYIKFERKKYFETEGSSNNNNNSNVSNKKNSSKLHSHSGNGPSHGGHTINSMSSDISNIRPKSQIPQTNRTSFKSGHKSAYAHTAIETPSEMKTPMGDDEQTEIELTTQENTNANAAMNGNVHIDINSFKHERNINTTTNTNTNGTHTNTSSNSTGTTQEMEMEIEMESKDMTSDNTNQNENQSQNTTTTAATSTTSASQKKNTTNANKTRNNSKLKKTSPITKSANNVLTNEKAKMESHNSNHHKFPASVDASGDETKQLAAQLMSAKVAADSIAHGQESTLELNDFKPLKTVIGASIGIGNINSDPNNDSTTETLKLPTIESTDDEDDEDDDNENENENEKVSKQTSMNLTTHSTITRIPTRKTGKSLHLLPSQSERPSGGKSKSNVGNENGKGDGKNDGHVSCDDAGNGNVNVGATSKHKNSNKHSKTNRHKSRHRHMKKSRSARNTLKPAHTSILPGSDKHGSPDQLGEKHHSRHHKRRKKRKSVRKSGENKGGILDSGEIPTRKRRHSTKSSKKSGKKGVTFNDDNGLSALDENIESKPDPNDTFESHRPNLQDINERTPNQTNSQVSFASFASSEDSGSDMSDVMADVSALTAKTPEALVQRSATDRVGPRKKGHGTKIYKVHSDGDDDVLNKAPIKKKPKLHKAVSETQKHSKRTQLHSGSSGGKSLALNLSDGDADGGSGKNVKELLGQIEVQMPSTWYSHRNQESFDFYEKLFNPDKLQSDSETEHKTNDGAGRSGNHSNSGTRRASGIGISRLSLRNVFSSKNGSGNVSTTKNKTGSVSSASKTNNSKIGENKNISGATKLAASNETKIYNPITNNHFGGVAFTGLAVKGLSPVNNESNSIMNGSIGETRGMGMGLGIGTDPARMGSLGSLTSMDGAAISSQSTLQSGDQTGQRRLKRGESQFVKLINSDIREESAAKRRYRYILYFPILVHLIFGLVSVVLGEWVYIIYAYPLIELILGFSLWCYVDIVILSCGGAHIVQESLEVQISAQDSYYRCVYCCCCRRNHFSICCERCCEQFCDRFFKANQIQCCSFDNSYSLHRCHLALLKIILCVVSPLLLAAIGVITSFDEIGNPLVEFFEALLHEMHIDFLEHDAYLVVLSLLLALNIFCIVTAAFVSGLIANSLHHISSLNASSLICKYASVFILSCLISIQFAIVVLAVTVSDKCQNEGGGNNTNGDNNNEGDNEIFLCIAPSIHMLLVYVELFVATCVNYAAFKNDDFEFWGEKVIPQINIYAYEHVIDFEKIHDLYNYRQVEGSDFLWLWEHPNNTPRASIAPSVVSMAQSTILEEKERDPVGDSMSDSSESGYGSETESDSESGTTSGSGSGTGSDSETETESYTDDDDDDDDDDESATENEDSWDSESLSGTDWGEDSDSADKKPKQNKKKSKKKKNKNKNKNDRNKRKSKSKSSKKENKSKSTTNKTENDKDSMKVQSQEKERVNSGSNTPYKGNQENKNGTTKAVSQFRELHRFDSGIAP